MGLNRTLTIVVSAALGWTLVQSSALAKSSDALEQRLERLERYMKNQIELQVELNQKITQLQTENQMLQGKIDEHQYELKKLSERQREIYRDLDSRIASGSGNAPPQVIQQHDLGNSVQSSTGEDPVVSEQVAYSKLFPLVRERRYDEAVKAYKGFLEQYPDGNNAVHAYYWLGQVYNVQRNYDEALQMFQTLLSKHPDAAKAGDALLKMGEIKMKKKEWEEAKNLFSQVVNRYGGSTAQLAKEQLQAIKKSGH